MHVLARPSVLLWALVAAVQAAGSGEAVGCGVNEYAERLQSFASGTLGFSTYTEKANHVHLTCYAVGDSGTIVQRTTTEFQRAQVGVGIDKTDDNAAYPCEGQSAYGVTLLEVFSLNGLDLHSDAQGEAESITINDAATCSQDESHAFYDGGVHLTQVVNEHLTIDTYVFKDAAAQAAANLQHTMTIGVLDKCKMELIFAFKPKAGGGLDAVIDVRYHAISQFESQINQAMQSVTHTDENKLAVYVPKDLLLAGAGLGPDGCGSTFSEPLLSEPGSGEGGGANGTMQHLLDVSLSFVCGSSGAVVAGTFDWVVEGTGKLRVSLTPEQAPESCTVLYWDPLITPLDTSTRAGVALRPGAVSGSDHSGSGALIAGIAGGVGGGAVALAALGAIAYKLRARSRRQLAKSMAAV